MNNCKLDTPLTINELIELNHEIQYEDNLTINDKNGPIQRLIIKSAWVDFCKSYFNQKGDEPTLFVTLLTNTKNKKHAIDGYRHFEKILRSKLYGRNGVNTPSKHLTIFPVIERHFHNDYYHFHLIIGFNPNNEASRAKTYKGLERMTKDAWKKVHIGQKNTFNSPNSILLIDNDEESFKQLISYVLKNVNRSEIGEVLVENL